MRLFFISLFIFFLLAIFSFFSFYKEQSRQGGVYKEKPQIKITIPEGFSAQDIDKKFSDINLTKQGELLKIIQEKKLEGYLFPDTYFFHNNDSAEAILQKMQDNFEKKINSQIREEISRQQKTLPEIIIMASLLEKEILDIKERKIASGILWKRLKVGMALQVDAAPATYKERGLPFQPISNPGLDSILAALYPIESGYWYYLSKPTGETVFSKTLEEHNLARAKYLPR